jgi:predicted NBD/HSP70 family sugar kinase
MIRQRTRQHVETVLGSSRKTLPEDARRQNRSLLLRALHHGGPASRAELAKLVGLTPATVSAVINDDLGAGLIADLGVTRGNVGKPATMVGIRADARHVVTIGLSEPERFVGAVIDLAGTVVARRSYPRDGRVGAAAAALVAEIADDMVALAAGEFPGTPLLGIGVATPGIVDADGNVRTATRLEWHGVALAADLAARTGMPVHVANDANAATLAELTFAHQGSTDLLLVRVDQGVGAGVVLGGRLLRGSTAAAGEIGHVVVDPTGAPCSCGKRGCLETQIAGPALEAQLDAARCEEDREAVLARVGTLLGAALALVVSTLDIAEIVFSGPPPVVGSTFRAAAREAIAARTLPEIADRLAIRPSTFGADDVSLGAAALVLDRELGIR